MGVGVLAAAAARIMHKESVINLFNTTSGARNMQLVLTGEGCSAGRAPIAAMGGLSLTDTKCSRDSNKAAAGCRPHEG